MENFHYRLLLGCLEAATLVMAYVLVIVGPEVRGAAASWARGAPKSASADDLFPGPWGLSSARLAPEI